MSEPANQQWPCTPPGRTSTLGDKTIAREEEEEEERGRRKRTERLGEWVEDAMERRRWRRIGGRMEGRVSKVHDREMARRDWQDCC